MDTLLIALFAFFGGGLLGITVMALVAAARDRRHHLGSDGFHRPLRPLADDDDDDDRRGRDTRRRY